MTPPLPNHGAGSPPSRPTRRRHLARLARRTLLTLAAALALSWLVALTLAFTLDPRRGPSRSREVWTPPGTFSSTQLWESPVSIYAETLWRFAQKRSWGTEQAAGPPDTVGSGDIQTAWASATQDGQLEWLTLYWDKPILASRILIHQTHNPGAISSITTGDPPQTLWTSPGIDALARILGVPVDPPRRLDSITLHINSPAVPGWNEIDAVCLVDAAGSPHYSDTALASSTYADRGGGAPPLQIPDWCNLTLPPSAHVNLLNERRATAAFGWPFPAWVATRTLDSMPSAIAPAGSKALTSPQSGPIAAVPFRPLLRAVALNTLMYAAILALLTLIILHPVRPIRRIIRMQRGQCPGCGYDLRFNFAAGCSECGFLRNL